MSSASMGGAVMASKAATKVTSVGSYSDLPSAPNATPATDSLSSDVVDTPPPTDFAAVTKALAPISETLNESAHEAMYPSPPINTPIIGSPSPSLSFRLPVRTRGFSLVGDRLTKLKLERHQLSHHCHDTDLTSSTACSAADVYGECDCDAASVSEMMSDGDKDKNCTGLVTPSTISVPIGLGSPAINPRIEEYLLFSSKDLPIETPAPKLRPALTKDAANTANAALGIDSLRSFDSDGVTEKTNWADEVDDFVEHTCLRLEQLAQDEHKTNPSKTVEEYYISRLNEFLGDSKRIAPAKAVLIANLKNKN